MKKYVGKVQRKWKGAEKEGTEGSEVYLFQDNNIEMLQEAIADKTQQIQQLQQQVLQLQAQHHPELQTTHQHHGEEVTESPVEITVVPLNKKPARVSTSTSTTTPNSKTRRSLASPSNTHSASPKKTPKWKTLPSPLEMKRLAAAATTTSPVTPSRTSTNPSRRSSSGRDSLTPTGTSARRQSLTRREPTPTRESLAVMKITPKAKSKRAALASALQSFSSKGKTKRGTFAGFEPADTLFFTAYLQPIDVNAIANS